MLEASELRIGNLVNLMLNHEDFETIYVDVTDLINIPHGGVYEPIPLTEEWLLKFGFEKSKSRFYYKKSFGVHLDFTAFNFKSCLWSSDNIKHVHQLQNLYFALTGEEINLK